MPGGTAQGARRVGLALESMCRFMLWWMPTDNKAIDAVLPREDAPPESGESSALLRRARRGDRSAVDAALFRGCFRGCGDGHAGACRVGPEACSIRATSCRTSCCTASV